MGHMSAIEAAGDLSSLFQSNNTTAVGGAVSSQMAPREAAKEQVQEEVEKEQQKTEEDTSQASGEEGTEEVKPEPKPEEKKPQASVAEINKAFRELRRMEKQVKADRQAALDLKAAVEAKEAKLKDLEELDKLNDMDVLKRIAERKGLSINSYLRNIIYQVSTGQEAPVEEKKEEEKKPETNPEVLALKAEIDAMNKKLEEKEKAEVEERNNLLVESYIDGAMELLSDDDFPLLSGENPEYLRQLVFKKADQYATEVGEAPDARELMEYLEAVFEREAQVMSDRLQKKTNRVKSSTEAATVSPSQEGSGSPDSRTKPEKAPALSNKVVAERSTGKDARKMTDRERLSEAARFLASRR